MVTLVVAYFTLATPKRVTRLVQEHLPEFVSHGGQIQRARLTLKTFPDLGLVIDQAVILSPMDGAPSDTLIRANKLTLAIDTKQYLKDKSIVFRQCYLDNVYVNLFTNEEGQSNLDILKHKTLEAAKKNFKTLANLRKMTMSHAAIVVTDLKSDVHLQAQGLDINLKNTLKGNDAESLMQLQSDQVNLNAKSIHFDAKQLDLDFNGTIKNFERIDGKASLNCPDLSMNYGRKKMQHEQVHQLFLPITNITRDKLKAIGK